TNTGNVTLDPTQMIDVLPAGLTFSSASLAPDSVIGQTVTWNNVSSLSPGTSAVVYVNATVDPGVVNATAPVVSLENCANTTGVPPNGNNVSAQGCANATVYYANVSVLKLDQTALQPSPGGVVQFNMTVTNTGNVTLDPIVLSDILPAGLTFQSASPTQD